MMNSGFGWGPSSDTVNHLSMDELMQTLQTPQAVPSPVHSSMQYSPGQSTALSVYGNGRSDSMDDIIRQLKPADDTQFPQPANFQCEQSPQHATYPIEGGSNANCIPEGGDSLQRAFTASGIGDTTDFSPFGAPSQSSAGYDSIATQSFSPIGESIYFSVEPDDVQFRYNKEVQSSNTSPIHGKGSSSPRIQVCNLKQGFRYRVVVTLTNEQGKPSMHALYKTKEESRVKEPVPRERTIPSYEVEVSDLNLENSIENIGIQRKTIRGESDNAPGRRASKGSEDSVHLLARLMAVRAINDEGIEVCRCLSNPIHDVKKSKLKICHINPSVVMEASKTEVTILCNKIKDDTEVHFSVGERSLTASISQRHHGVALVVLVPPCPPDLFTGDDSVMAKVTLYCPKTKRSSEPVSFWYKMDIFPSVRNMNRQRSRSPMRGLLETDSCSDTDSLAASIRGLQLKEEPQESTSDEATDVKCKPVVCAAPASKSQPKMADLSRVRAVARGEESWSDEVDRALTRSPFVLQVQDSKGFTPLTEALTNGQEEVFRRFLEAMDSEERGHLLTGRSHHGASLLHLVAVPNSASIGTVNLLLLRGADPRVVDKNGQSVLHWLVRRGRVTLMKEALVSFRRWLKENALNPKSEMVSLVNRIDNDGRSALHTAVIFRVVAAVVPLLDEGADVNLMSPHNGYTALHWAAVVEDEAAVKLLLQRGARKRKKTKHGATALQLIHHLGPTADGMRERLSVSSSSDSGSPSP